MIVRMDGRVTAVVGAGPGIGGESGRLFAESGAAVACLDVLEERAVAAAETLAALGVATSAHTVDVRHRASVDAAFAEIENEHGRLDAVVDVVGMSRKKPAGEMDDSDWDDIIDINLRQQFLVGQRAAQTMRRMGNGGSYVAIGSICGLTSSPMQSVYGIAKAGVSSLVRTFAIEYASEQIRFNAVSPGVALTPRMVEAGFAAGEQHDRFASEIPFGRIARPEEIAATVVFLCSDLGAYITGQVIGVDGGASAKYALPIP